MSYNAAALFAEIRARIERTPETTLKELCNALVIHRQTAREVVRDATGKTFRAWVRQERVKRASALLAAHPTMTIGQVASACGFGSTQAFDRFCRSHLGDSPSRLRRTMASTRPFGCQRGCLGCTDCQYSSTTNAEL